MRNNEIKSLFRIGSGIAVFLFALFLTVKGVQAQPGTCSPGDLNAGSPCSVNTDCDQVAVADGLGTCQPTSITTTSQCLQTLVSNCPNVTPWKQKVCDAIPLLDKAINELCKTPPDNIAATGAIEGAVGDLDAAVGLGFDPLNCKNGSNNVMDRLAGIARQMAKKVLDDACGKCGQNDSQVCNALLKMNEGDTFRGLGLYKDAVGKYKDAKGLAEDVVDTDYTCNTDVSCILSCSC